MKRTAGGIFSVAIKYARSMRAQLLLLAVITGVASRGMAQCDYQVTSLADSGAGTLRAGLATAPTTTDICFSVQGTITLQSPLQINAPVTITGSNGVTISGNNTVGIFVIAINGEYYLPMVTISGLTLSGGNATAGNNIYGGAIWVQEGPTTLSNMTITGNTAESGGALYTQDTVFIQNSTISNNTATTGAGGAIANENSDGTLTIQNTTISGNTSPGGSGGALDNGGAAQVTGGTFQGNSADYGGAIDNEYYATLTISGGTTFSSNISTINGGAIENYGTANITAALFNANQAQGNSDSVGCGGGICNESTLTVTESTFLANTTTGSGGGIESDFGTIITLQDDTIYGNTADYTGSGLDLEQSSSAPIVENTVIAGNAAIQGQANPDCFGCAAATQGGDLIGGTANLGPLANNGGPTLTMMPLPAGNLIGLGVPADTADSSDQRGFSRIASNSSIDIGAVQSHYSSVSFLAQPSNTLINQAITPAVSVQVIEVDGETTNFPQGVPVTLSLIPPQGVNATLTGTLTQSPTVTNQVTAAVFPGLSVNTPGSFQIFATDAIQGNSGSADPTYQATSSAFQISQPVVVTLQWQPAAVAYGPLPAGELNATATVNGAPGTGTFVYTFVPSGATINVGQTYPVNSYSVQVAYTPTGSTTTYTDQTTLQITQAAPVLSWGTPAPIYTSTALSATQLDATAKGVTGAALPGTFTYTPVAGTKLTAGPHTLSTTFTPTDAADYTTTTAQVNIQVNALAASTAVIQTSASPITFGQSETFTAVVTGNDGNPFSGGTAAFSVDGVGIGSAPVVNGLASVTDATLTGGTHQVVLTYTDATLTLLGNTSLTVNKASPTLAWATPAPIYTSMALSATQLDATATGVTAAALAGTFTYTPATGTQLTAGPHTLGTTFTPTDMTDYATATMQVTIQVNAVTASTAVIQTSANPITFGQSETFTAVVTGTDGNPTSGGTAAFTADGVAIGSASVVNGLASVTDATLTGGTHQVVLTYTNAALTLSSNTTLTVSKASPTLTWPTPAPIYTSTALSATQLDATVKGVTGASLPGATVYNPAAGSMLTAGTDTLSVTFTPTDTVDYTTATAQVSITVGYTPLSISVAAPASVALSTNPTTIAITGSGLTSTTVAELNGTALPTTVSSATSLTATIAASFLSAVGTYNLTVYDSASKLTSNALTFAVTAPAADLTVSVSAQLTSADQPVIGLVLNTAYPSALAGTMTLSFTPASSSGVDDPAVQFASGRRTFSFTVAAGSTTTPQVALQTGTVAGTINVTLSLTADGVDVTPAGVSPVTLVIAPAVPVVTSVTFTNSGTGQLTVVVNGFSNTRDMSGADFVFTGTGASALGSSTASVTTTSLFTPWFASAPSDAYGSEFTYTQNFQLSQPDSGITGVSVTLTNSIGTSESVSSQ
jgi:predicted outer membrane repeat protein